MSKETVITNIFLNAEELQNLLYNNELDLLHTINSIEFIQIMNLSSENRYRFLWFDKMVKERFSFAKQLINTVYTYHEKYNFEALDFDILDTLQITLESTTGKLKTINRRYKYILINGTINTDIIPSKEALLSGSKVIVRESQNWNLLLNNMHEQWNIN